MKQFGKFFFHAVTILKNSKLTIVKIFVLSQKNFWEHNLEWLCEKFWLIESYIYIPSIDLFIRLKPIRFRVESERITKSSNLIFFKL